MRREDASTLRGGSVFGGRTIGATSILGVGGEPSNRPRRAIWRDSPVAITETQHDPHAMAVARTQALFREVNEQLERLAVKFGIDHSLDFVCECGNHRCSENVELSLSEYEAIRRIPTRFVVKPGHVLPKFERSVEQQRAYTVVEKFGDGGVAAVRLDPRRRRHLAAVSDDAA
jgi:hypothetical protein